MNPGRIAAVLAIVAWTLPATAWRNATLEDALNATNFRNIGPFRTSAWVTEIAVPDTPAREHLYTIYAATRTGGLWKTTNNGITWTPISDSVEVSAVGAVAVAPSNSNIVWMGTGDQANARSSYSGKGVFKSTDAGKTWQLMGLPDSHHIARIVIHPTNPEIVYVAAMGHLFSRNEERGVFRTRERRQDVGEGALCRRRHRRDRSRDQPARAVHAVCGDVREASDPMATGPRGPGSGVYRTDDGGTKWQKLEGLPSGNVGRIGIDINAGNPNVLTLIVENLNPRKEGMPARTDACRVGRRGAAGGAHAQARRADGQRGLSQRGWGPHVDEDAR